MFRKLFLCFILFIAQQVSGWAQNLPSLITGQNINSTFSIIAFDPQAKEWGIAVATNNICVGNSTCYVEPGLGAFSVIAETEPKYATNGFQQLREGKTIEQAIFYTKDRDTMADYRQVSGIDAKGNVFAFTGSTLKYWKGNSTSILGKGYAVMGNQLAPETLKDMACTFEHSTGTVAERLLQALIAGEHAGGQISGKQSAALLVKGTDNEYYNNVDLRVDHSKDPFADLQRLLNYYYGRIRLNQASYSLNMGDKKRADSLLGVTVQMTKGWYGLYPRIAKAYLGLGNEPAAIRLIKAAVKAEPKWKENISAFYCLYNHKEISSLYPVARFTVMDWNNAISVLTDLEKTEQAISLAKKVLQKHPSSSYTWYELAKAYLQNSDKQAASAADLTALNFDPDNADAKRLLKEISH